MTEFSDPQASEANVRWKPNMDKLNGEGWSDRHLSPSDSSDNVGTDSLTRLQQVYAGEKPLELEDIAGAVFNITRSSGEVDDGWTPVELRRSEKGVQVVIFKDGSTKTVTVAALAEVNPITDGEVIKARSKGEPLPPRSKALLLLEAESSRFEEQLTAAREAKSARETIQAALDEINSSPALRSMHDFEGRIALLEERKTAVYARQQQGEITDDETRLSVEPIKESISALVRQRDELVGPVDRKRYRELMLKIGIAQGKIG